MTSELVAGQSRLTNMLQGEYASYMKNGKATLQNMWNLGRLLAAANPGHRFDDESFRIEGIPRIPYGEWGLYLERTFPERTSRSAQIWMDYYLKNLGGCPAFGPNSLAALGSGEETSEPEEETQEDEEEKPLTVERMVEEIYERAPRYGAEALVERVDSGTSIVRNEYAIIMAYESLSPEVGAALVEHGIGAWEAIPDVQRFFDNDKVNWAFHQTFGMGIVPLYDDRYRQTGITKLGVATAEQIRTAYVAEVRGHSTAEWEETKPPRHLDATATLRHVARTDEGVIMTILIPGVSDNDYKKLMEQRGARFRAMLDELREPRQ